jgi:3-isopropylmalate/(R)-2-methylmalate dehydratase small subunit
MAATGMLGHQRLFVEGLDLVGASLAHRETIAAFAQAHWTKQPWLRAVATTSALD